MPCGLSWCCRRKPGGHLAGKQQRRATADAGIVGTQAGCLQGGKLQVAPVGSTVLLQGRDMQTSVPRC